MTGRGGQHGVRRVFWWSVGSRVPLALLLALCAAAGIRSVGVIQWIVPSIPSGG